MLEVANTRVEQLKANGFPQAAVYDPPGVGGTGVVTVLAFGDRPELYGLPSRSHGARRGALLEGPAQVARQPRDPRRPGRGGDALRALRPQGRTTRRRARRRAAVPSRLMSLPLRERLVHAASRGVLRLPAAHRAGVLDAGALLARDRARRRLPLAAAASLGRPRLRGGRRLDVRRSGGARCARPPRIARGARRCGTTSATRTRACRRPAASTTARRSCSG